MEWLFYSDINRPIEDVTCIIIELENIAIEKLKKDGFIIPKHLLK